MEVVFRQYYFLSKRVLVHIFDTSSQTIAAASEHYWRTLSNPGLPQKKVYRQRTLEPM
jgi:hypothetical protein